MFLNWYQHIPLHIDPIAFAVGSFSLRWYAVSYVFCFLAIYSVLSWRIRHGEADNFFQASDIVTDYLLVMFFWALIGGRIGYVLFYNLPYYQANPWAIISPFDHQSGHYVGIFGMSYHGALVSVIIGSMIFLKKRKVDFLAWADFIVPAVALGYFFGRVGNFLNGELLGRLTDFPFGMYFSADSDSLRHPSQLYEAFLEGIVLYVVLWSLRKKNLEKGSLFGIYLIGYGLARIVAEQFRQPDAQLGFLWNYFTMGQILSFVMLLVGLLLLVPKKKKQ